MFSPISTEAPQTRPVRLVLGLSLLWAVVLVVANRDAFPDAQSPYWSEVILTEWMPKNTGPLCEPTPHTLIFRLNPPGQLCRPGSSTRTVRGHVLNFQAGTPETEIASVSAQFESRLARAIWHSQLSIAGRLFAWWLATTLCCVGYGWAVRRAVVALRPERWQTGRFVLFVLATIASLAVFFAAVGTAPSPFVRATYRFFVWVRFFETDRFTDAVWAAVVALLPLAVATGAFVVAWRWFEHRERLKSMI